MMKNKIKKLKSHHDKLMNQIYKTPSINLALRSKLTREALFVLFQIERLESKNSTQNKE